jgi:hypothetical protein
LPPLHGRNRAISEGTWNLGGDRENPDFIVREARNSSGLNYATSLWDYKIVPPCHEGKSATL